MFILNLFIWINKKLFLKFGAEKISEMKKQHADSADLSGFKRIKIIASVEKLIDCIHQSIVESILCYGAVEQRKSA